MRSSLWELNRPFQTTAYGYIEVGAQREKSFVYPVKRFIERPNLEVATEIIRKKNVFWNAGSFMMRTYFGEDDIFRYEDEYGRKK